MSLSALIYRRLIWLPGAAILIGGALVWLWVSQPVNAAPPAGEPVPLMVPAAEDGLLFQAGRPSDLSCRLCHGETERELTLPSGETLPVQVNLAALGASAHGHSAETPLVCTDCHRPAADYRFPHAPVEAVDLDAYRLERSLSCEQCHTPHLTSHPGPESDNPVLCVDCHTGHEVVTTSVWQAGEATTTCLACHEPEDRGRLTGLIQAGMFAPKVDDVYCLACHTQPDLTMTFPNGDVLSLTIDPDAYYHSVHGEGNEWATLACADCHGEYTYPHEPVAAGSAREYALEKYPVCATCHEQNYDMTLDAVHGEALLAGNYEAATCTDCHGAHDTPPPGEPRGRISLTCQECHGEAFEAYAGSVHGVAVLSDDSPDAPTCVDCHGVHDITDPHDVRFRLRSPELCAQCHLDEEMMGRYDVSTEVYETYVADFHGTTVTLFDHDDPTIAVNVAVCADCHGFHDIMSVSHPEAGLAIRENLLITCQECHPDATANFSDAWTSHHRPSLEHNVLVFLVITFYQIFIPLVLGFLSFLVLTDIYRRIRTRLQAG